VVSGSIGSSIVARKRKSQWTPRVVSATELNHQDDSTRRYADTPQSAHADESGDAGPTDPSDQIPGSNPPIAAALNDAADSGQGIPSQLARIADAIDLLVESACRIADQIAPEPPAHVGTPYVARHLGCTTVWVAEQARDGHIPSNCIIPGTGNGKPWKFYRARIDAWIEAR
jgi:hypothetical protein